MIESSTPTPCEETDEDDLIVFTHVPAQRIRHDGWSPAKQDAFIAAPPTSGLVATAARVVGMSANSAYRLRRHPQAESFAAAWNLAVREARQRALDTAMELATKEFVAARYYRGRFVGIRGGFDDRMLRAVLRSSGVMPRTQAAAKVTNEAILRNFIGGSSG